MFTSKIWFHYSIAWFIGMSWGIFCVHDTTSGIRILMGVICGVIGILWLAGLRMIAEKTNTSLKWAFIGSPFGSLGFPIYTAVREWSFQPLREDLPTLVVLGAIVGSIVGMVIASNCFQESG